VLQFGHEIGDLTLTGQRKIRKREAGRADPCAHAFQPLSNAASNSGERKRSHCPLALSSAPLHASAPGLVVSEESSSCPHLFWIG
jgi:hypothetical protein